MWGNGMSLFYSRDSKGAKTFSGILQNVSDPRAPVDLSLKGDKRYFVQFISPTGKRYEEEANINEDEVDNTADDMDIYLHTSPENPIYSSELGRWAYRVGVEFENGVITTSPEWVPFWVAV